MAIKEYIAILGKDPDNASVYYNLGIAYDEMGQLKKAIALKPDYPEALSNLGIIYGKMGFLDEAIQQLRRSLDISPRDPMTLFNLGFAYERLAKRKDESKPWISRKELIAKAIETYEKVIMLDPDNAGARERIQKLRADD